MWTDASNESGDDDVSDFDEEMIEEMKAELASLSKPTPYSTVSAP